MCTAAELTIHYTLGCVSMDPDVLTGTLAD